MKYLKALGLAAIAAGALLAFVGAGTASATTLDCSAPPNPTMCPTGQVIHAEVEGTAILHPPIGDIECSKSTVQGKTTNEGSSTETVNGPIEALTFEQCNATVSVLKKGELIVHTDVTAEDPEGKTGNGILTSNGAEVTVEFAGFHCIFSTKNTPIGTVTGSTDRAGSTATLDISADIERTGGRSNIFCGSTAEWTGSYSVDTPMYLNIT